MEINKKMGILGILLFFLILFILPLFLPVYWIMIISEILIMGLMAMSFNLLLGYTGLLSFGQGAFFGIGAYTAAIMLQSGANNIFFILVVGALMASFFSLIVGYFSVKHDEIFFAMITLGFGMLFFTIAHNWVNLTGGSDGLPIFNLPVLGFLGKEINFYTPLSMYYLIFSTVFFSVFVQWAVVNSPFGLILCAIRENKMRVPFVGGNVKLLRIMVFTIAGFFTGISGVLFCLFNNMATPEFMHWSFSAKPVIMSILGGSTVFLGPFFGAGIFFVLEQIFIIFTDSWMLFLGMILIPIVIFFPEGVFGTILKKFNRRKV